MISHRISPTRNQHVKQIVGTVNTSTANTTRNTKQIAPRDTHETTRRDMSQTIPINPQGGGERGLAGVGLCSCLTYSRLSASQRDVNDLHVDRITASSGAFSICSVRREGVRLTSSGKRTVVFPVPILHTGPSSSSTKHNWQY